MDDETVKGGRRPFPPHRVTDGAELMLRCGRAGGQKASGRLPAFHADVSMKHGLPVADFLKRRARRLFELTAPLSVSLQAHAERNLGEQRLLLQQ